MKKVRHAARIFLINADNKILLMQVGRPDAFGKDNPTCKPYWITPGGQLKVGDSMGLNRGEIETGETTEQAARRELYEETGITDAKFIVPHVFYSEVELMHKGEPTIFKEWYFVARTKTSTISTENFTEQEKVAIDAHQWWSLDELRETSTIFFPSNLVEIVEPFAGTRK